MSENRNGSGGAKQTLVEEGTVFRGSIASDCPIVVKGTLEGEISGPSLWVSSTGEVSGKVKMQEIRSEGVLSGEFDAEVVQLAGRVKDNTVIKARSLEVKLAPQSNKMQVVFGECALEVGDEPQRPLARPASAEVRPAPVAVEEVTDRGQDDEWASDGNGRAKRRSKAHDTTPPQA